MLCRRPSTRGAVFPTFDPAVHVRPFCDGAGEVVIGVDFGFSGDFASLWVRVGEGGRLHVLGEHVEAGRTLPEHAAVLRSKSQRLGVRRIFCDPAGAAVNGHTGESDVAVLRRAGFAVLHRPRPDRGRRRADPPAAQARRRHAAAPYDRPVVPAG